MRSPTLSPLPFHNGAPRRLSRRSRFGLVILTCICVLIVCLFASQLALSSPPFYRSIHRLIYGHLNQETITSPEPDVWQERAEATRSAFRFAYTAYEETAYPHDELKPLSNRFQDKCVSSTVNIGLGTIVTDRMGSLNGWGASTVDSIDTMILMRFDDLVEQSLMHVSKLKLNQNEYVPFFETVIRYLGGLLSAYALTNNPVYLTHADELGMRLLPIFDTMVGLPSFSVNMQTGMGRSGWLGPFSILSEFASCQMEYRYLAHLTGRAEYIDAVDRLTDFLQDNSEHGGLFPLHFSVYNGAPASDRFSVGAQADSAYEYFLKQWLLTGKSEPRFLDMYLRSADAIIENMLYVSPSRRLLYVTDIFRPSLQPVHDFQHLSCFLSGLFALGASTIPDIDPRHAWAAEGLGHTCWITYADTATGLGPEQIAFPENGTRWVDELKRWEDLGRLGTVPGTNETTPAMPGEDLEYRVMDARYLLRPETIESIYIMWRTTGDIKWRERGWALFESIEKHAKTETAYASVADVRQLPAPPLDDLPSFFFAETLKYAYLLFTDEDLLPLDKWVLNTEAHPIPIFKWSQSETKLFSTLELQESNGTSILTLA
ncbi:glycoside hydrolase family 47 protein [Cytidiella melzeri]|nr:glycoside hydrolase family 47 protein [Cytidiella melzeri]